MLLRRGAGSLGSHLHHIEELEAVCVQDREQPSALSQVDAAPVSAEDRGCCQLPAERAPGAFPDFCVCRGSPNLSAGPHPCKHRILPMALACLNPSAQVHASQGGASTFRMSCINCAYYAIFTQSMLYWTKFAARFSNSKDRRMYACCEGPDLQGRRARACWCPCICPAAQVAPRQSRPALAQDSPCSRTLSWAAPGHPPLPPVHHSTHSPPVENSGLVSGLCSACHALVSGAGAGHNTKGSSLLPQLLQGGCLKEREDANMGYRAAHLLVVEDAEGADCAVVSGRDDVPAIPRPGQAGDCMVVWLAGPGYALCCKVPDYDFSQRTSSCMNSSLSLCSAVLQYTGGAVSQWCETGSSLQPAATLCNLACLAYLQGGYPRD